MINTHSALTTRHENRAIFTNVTGVQNNYGKHKNFDLMSSAESMLIPGVQQ